MVWNGLKSTHAGRFHLLLVMIWDSELPQYFEEDAAYAGSSATLHSLGLSLLCQNLQARVFRQFFSCRRFLGLLASWSLLSLTCYHLQLLQNWRQPRDNSFITPNPPSSRREAPSREKWILCWIQTRSKPIWCRLEIKLAEKAES